MVLQFNLKRCRKLSPEIQVNETLALAIAFLGALGNPVALTELETHAARTFPGRGLVFGILGFGLEVAILWIAKKRPGYGNLRLGSTLFFANLPMTGCLALAIVLRATAFEPLLTLRMLLTLLGVFWLFHTLTVWATLLSLGLFLRAIWRAAFGAVRESA